MGISELLGAAALILLLINTVLLLKLLKTAGPESQAALRRELSGALAEQRAAVSAELREAMAAESRSTRTELTSQVQLTMRTFADSLSAAQAQAAERQDIRLRELTELMGQNQQQLSGAVSEKMAALQETLKETAALLSAAQTRQFEMQDKRMEDITGLLTKAQGELRTTVTAQLQTVAEQFQAFTAQNRTSLDGIRSTVQERLEHLQSDNRQQLEKMRATVDEKLQKTLDDRITQSFQMVNERLQEVYTGLGEMKTLASGVGDLKKVLSNVKTRGIVGEYQLGAIIDEILTREQYAENVVTKKGATTRVEYAIRLPGENGQEVLLPVDAKFPGDTYAQLVDAYETGDPAAIAAAQSLLESRIKGCARDIRDKYIDPPNTTDFAIMFLPFEGLYAEVVRSGMVEVLQRQYKVNIAGPTTFAALLNSLQMGFRTLAIQKRSGEVWNVLSAVKTEFGKFEEVLSAAQKRIEQTGAELDKLVGTRTRKINSKLREVSLLPSEESRRLLDTAPDTAEGDEG